MKIIKKIKQYFNSHTRSIHCEECHTSFYLRFKDGEPPTNQEVSCTYCGNKGNTHFATAVGGYMQLYI